MAYTVSDSAFMTVNTSTIRQTNKEHYLKDGLKMMIRHVSADCHNYKS